MPYDETPAGRVRRVLAGHDVVERRMMGALAFMVNDAMRCCATGDALMVRVDPAKRDAALAEPHVRPMLMRGRAMKSFVVVDAPGIADEVALRRWVQRGLDAPS